MAITTIVFGAVVIKARNWSLGRALPLIVLFLAFDVAFLAANAAKFAQGGWFPVALAIGVFVVMTTWHRGRQLLHEAIQPLMLPLDLWVQDVARTKPYRVNGTAIFMSSNPDGVPSALLHNFKHNQVLHEQVVLLSIQNVPAPQVPSRQRTTVQDLGEGFFRVVAQYGFMERPDVPHMLRRARQDGLEIDLDRTSYYLGRETLVTTGRSKMARWRKALFAFISRNARPATAYFGLPPGRVVELGLQVRF
jgi:KUP system potassium uptake protein